MELHTPETVEYQTILDLLKTPIRHALLDQDAPLESQTPGYEYSAGYARFTKDHCEHQEGPELQWGITESVLQLDRLVLRDLASEEQANIMSNLMSVRHAAYRELIEPMILAFMELGAAFTVKWDVEMKSRRDNREAFFDNLKPGPDGDFVFSYRNNSGWAREQEVPYLLLRTILPFSINRYEWMNWETRFGLQPYGLTQALAQQARKQSSRLGCPHIVLFDGSTLVHIELKALGNQPFDPLDPLTPVNVNVVWDFEDGVNSTPQASSRNNNQPQSTMREVLFSTILSSIKRAACEVLTFPPFLPNPGSFNTPLGVDSMQGNSYPAELEGYVVTRDRVGKAVYYKEIDSSLSISISGNEEFMVEAYSPASVTGLRRKRFIWMRWEEGAVVPISIAF